MGGRRYSEAAKMAAKSQDSCAVRELVRTLPAPFDAVPGRRRVGQGRAKWWMLCRSVPSPEGGDPVMKWKGEIGYRGEREEPGERKKN